MTPPWLHIVGLGASGMDSLAPATRALVEAAEILVGAPRHHALTAEVSGAERLDWPVPFDALIESLRAHRGRRLVVLATGDPLWFSVGARIGREIPPGEIVYHPQLSAFQLAAARLGWSLADAEALTAHGRPPEQILPFLAPGARLLVLTADGETPAQLARLLVDRGYGQSQLTVLSDLGAADEAIATAPATGWVRRSAPALNTVAIECHADAGAQMQPRVPGLPDEVFEHDGQMTKREVRAVTLSRLMPHRGAVLWDIGAGCGSVGIEWMRAARDAIAIGIEPDAGRRSLAAVNALALGVPKLELRAGTAPKALEGLPVPDAVFIGGGLTSEVAHAALSALAPLGRLVANAVTVQSETLLAQLHARHGGSLVRLSVARACPIGGAGLMAWDPAMPVTQWSLVKR